MQGFTTELWLTWSSYSPVSIGYVAGVTGRTILPAINCFSFFRSKMILIDPFSLFTSKHQFFSGPSYSVTFPPALPLPASSWFTADWLLLCALPVPPPSHPRGQLSFHEFDHTLLWPLDPSPPDHPWPSPPHLGPILTGRRQKFATNCLKSSCRRALQWTDVIIPDLQESVLGGLQAH